MTQATQLYYKTRLAVVRHTEIADVFELSRNMREADKIEIWKSDHKTPEEALLGGFMDSAVCWTIERKEKPIAMFGVVPNSILGPTASVWLLAAPELTQVQRAFLRHSRHFIGIMLGYYPIIANWVDIDNRESIRWLKWCGAEFGPIMPYGAEQAPFQHFRFRRI